VTIDTPTFAWLDFIEKSRGGRVHYAGDDWGLYGQHHLPDGSFVAIVTDSAKCERAST
jgi:hypothetical protein